MLISVDINNGIEMGSKEVSSATFKELSLKESDIEEFLRKNIDLIADDETLLIVGQQVIDSERGRSDLTAIDENGNLVLIEIKRDKESSKSRKEPLELQAIRYAASLAKINTPDELVSRIYESYIEKYYYNGKSELTPSEIAKRQLLNFLSENNALNTFNANQRIILVASSFDTLALSSVAWLISNNVDISCYTIEPTKINRELYMEVLKVLPVPKLEDYYTEVKEKKSTESRFSNSSTSKKRRDLPRIPKLFEHDLLKSGDILNIKNQDNSEAVVVDSRSVKFREVTMSFNDWGKEITGWSSICIYDWAVKVDDDKTLGQLRLDMISSLEAEDASL